MYPGNDQSQTYSERYSVTAYLTVGEAYRLVPQKISRQEQPVERSTFF